MNQVTLPIYLVTAGFILASTNGIAGEDVPFDEAELFF